MIDPSHRTFSTSQHVLVTGGAGYIGSLLTGVLLSQGHEVTVVDDLLFGGESLLGYWHHPRFRFAKADVCDRDLLKTEGSKLKVGTLTPARFDAIVHLAAIVGFPACQAVGKQVAWRYNVESTKRVFEAAEAAGVERFILASTYSNYGVAENGRPVTEESPLYPQSLYAETKIAAEQYLLEQAKRSRCAPLIFRFATLFGISPRTRFDLIVNQFVLEALTKRELVIYQRGYSRSFVHVRDVVDGIILGLSAPEAKIRGHIFNLGSDSGNFTKDEIVALVQKHVDRLKVTYKDLSFGGDMRDIAVSFAKIKRELGFEPKVSMDAGILEVKGALESGLIKDATDSRYRNAQFIVQ
jgi:nucleoside-diphosphate-sugar epimerase